MREREAPRFRARLTVAKEKGKGKMSSGEEGGEVGRSGEGRGKCGKAGRKKGKKKSAPPQDCWPRRLGNRDKAAGPHTSRGQ